MTQALDRGNCGTEPGFVGRKPQVNHALSINAARRNAAHQKERGATILNGKLFL
jgi:hypothetical protein